MLKNYLRIALRNLSRNKSTSAISIGGLAVGMAVAILIGLWVYDELSFDKNFKNYTRIARVMQNQTFNGEVETWRGQAMQLAPELRNTYGSNFKYVIMSSWTENHTLTFGEKKFSKGGNFMEPDVTEMLALKILRGSRAGLKEPNSIMLTASLAKTMFGDVDPMDKIINIDNKYNVKVTGVFEDFPDNCSFSGLSYLAPWQLKVINENLVQRVNWGNSWFQIYAQIADNVNMAQASANIKNSKLNRVLVEDDDARFKPEIFLHSMNKWHLYSEFKNGVNVGGSIQYVRLFGIIGIFVLLLACINFMNLSTARSEKRAKEVGIRKAIGSLRGQLIGQFFSESILVAFFAFALSLLLVLLSMPFFNEVVGKKMNIPWFSALFWLMGLAFILVTGLLAGSYPALYLSSFRPVKVLKGVFKSGRFAAMPRKALVVVQFTVSIILIIGTIVILRQIEYAKDRPVGYSREGLITVAIKSKDIKDHFDAFRSDLLKTGMVQEVAASETPVTSTNVTNSGFNWKGKDPNMTEEFVTMGITHEFGKTAGWQIIAGRDFSKEFATDTAGFVINEAAAKFMGLKNPVGETIKWNNNGDWKILGVIKDLVTQSPFEPVKQTMFYLNNNRLSFIDIKINPGKSTGEVLSRIEPVFKKYDPANPFEYKFADQEYEKKFGYEERIGKLATSFAMLAIFISCLGLFGLASYVAEQRTKEIGVRKVLGATVFNVWRLLSKDFVLLVIISLFIAVPLGYYFMNNWLQDYHYRADLSWWIFAAAGTGALIITILTVSFQAIKAALMNPVKSLRTE